MERSRLFIRCVRRPSPLVALHGFFADFDADVAHVRVCDTDPSRALLRSVELLASQAANKRRLAGATLADYEQTTTTPRHGSSPECCFPLAAKQYFSNDTAVRALRLEVGAQLVKQVLDLLSFELAEELGAFLHLPQQRVDDGRSAVELHKFAPVHAEVGDDIGESGVSVVVPELLDARRELSGAPLADVAGDGRQTRGRLCVAGVILGGSGSNWP